VKTNIYFIQAVHGGPVKIGRAANVVERLRQHQTASPVELRIVRLMHDVPKARESELHQLFKPYRISGEWFSPAVLEIAKSVTIPTSATTRPEFIRLPKPFTVCPYSSLARSKMNELILPSEINGHCPPVKSVCLRQPGALKGVRLVHLQSLMDYLHAQMESPAKLNGQTA